MNKQNEIILTINKKNDANLFFLCKVSRLTKKVGQLTTIGFLHFKVS
jgi:hypothetical protein